MAALRAELAIGPAQPVLALLPGSRRGEVTRLAPVFAEVARRLRARMPELAVIVPAAAPVVGLLDATMKADDAGWPHVIDPRGFAAPVWEARKRAAFAAADVALAASGTVSLELAAAGTPMVIAYDANALTRVDREAHDPHRHGDARQPRHRHPGGPRVPLRALQPGLITPAVERLFEDAGRRRRSRRRRPTPRCASSAAAASPPASAPRARCLRDRGSVVERRQAVKSATVAPMASASACGATEKTWFGVPAAAQITS